MLGEIAYKIEKGLREIYRKAGIKPFEDDEVLIKINYKYESPYTGGLVSKGISEARGKYGELDFLIRKAVDTINGWIANSPNYKMGFVTRSCFIIKLITPYGSYETTLWK